MSVTGRSASDDVAQRLGFDAGQLTAIVSVLGQNPRIRRAVVFGSRAKGTARPSSDVDLAVDGALSPLELASIADELDELPIPFKFDVVGLRSLSSQPLRQHIARVGVPIFGRE